MDNFLRLVGIYSKYYLLIRWMLRRYSTHIGFRQLSGGPRGLLGSCFLVWGGEEGHALGCWHCRAYEAYLAARDAREMVE